MAAFDIYRVQILRQNKLGEILENAPKILLGRYMDKKGLWMQDEFDDETHNQQEYYHS